MHGDAWTFHTKNVFWGFQEYLVFLIISCKFQFPHLNCLVNKCWNFKITVSHIFFIIMMRILSSLGIYISVGNKHSQLLQISWFWASFCSFSYCKINYKSSVVEQLLKIRGGVRGRTKKFKVWRINWRRKNLKKDLSHRDWKAISCSPRYKNISGSAGEHGEVAFVIGWSPSDGALTFGLLGFISTKSLQQLGKAF